MAELPGNVHEKIGDLRIERGLPNQKTGKRRSGDTSISAYQNRERRY